MIAGDAAGTVTIWEHGRKGLYADDLGLTVRRSASRSRRYAWSEIGRLADGGRTFEGVELWVLLIVLHKGPSVQVRFLKGRPEVLTAIRQVAERYGIPADVTGVPMKAGKPLSVGLFEDPWGQAGLRYWDGTEWSPLLPLDVFKQPHARKSEVPWRSLPVAEVSWMFPSSRARLWARWTIVCAIVSAALLTVGLAIPLWWDREPHHRHISGMATVLWLVTAFSFAWLPLVAWHERGYFLRLDAAARRSAESGDGTLHEF